MAKQITVTVNLEGVDAGETMFERQYELARETGDVATGTARVVAGASKRFCIAGEENAAAAPISLDLTKIRGYVLDLDSEFELRIDTELAGHLVGPGQVAVSRTAIDGFTLLNNGAAQGSVRYCVWGDQ